MNLKDPNLAIKTALEQIKTPVLKNALTPEAVESMTLENLHSGLLYLWQMASTGKL